MIKKQKSNKRKVLLTAGSIASFLIVLFVFYYFFGPRPSGRYFSSIINKIGAPSGYTVSSTDIRDNLLEQKYARRTYIGNDDPGRVKQEMVERFKKAGFKDVALTSPSGTGGVYAACKGASVFARINQKGDKPIDIEVFATNYPGAPRCPWIF